jgi:hypothetical protein
MEWWKLNHLRTKKKPAFADTRDINWRTLTGSSLPQLGLARKSARSELLSQWGSFSAMRKKMAADAQGDKVLLGILSALATKFFVMNFQV